jgi:sugar/nucleoside kinase (ribokinase family)
MNRSLDCLCAGIIVADQVCEPVAQMPPSGGLALTPRMEFTVGGCAANVAVDMAKLGLNIGLSGCVGDDLFGRAVSEMLQRAGVDCAALRAIPTHPTSGTFVINVKGEDRRFIHCVGANAAYDGTQISDADLQAAKVLYVGGYCLLESLTPKKVRQLFERARAVGVTTVLDVVLPEQGEYQSWITPVLPVTDWFFPNFDESKRLTGLNDPWQQAARFRADGCQGTAITCGGDGAVLDCPAGRWQAGVYDVPAVDATGTGDAFVSGFIYGLLRGTAPEQCLRWGTALGASCVRHLGATTGVFTAPELMEFAEREELVVKRVGS